MRVDEFNNIAVASALIGAAICNKSPICQCGQWNGMLFGYLMIPVALLVIRATEEILRKLNIAHLDRYEFRYLTPIGVLTISVLIGTVAFRITALALQLVGVGCPKNPIGFGWQIVAIGITVAVLFRATVQAATYIDSFFSDSRRAKRALQRQPRWQ